MPDVKAPPEVELGQIWRLKDSEPWNPPRFEVVEMAPGWARIKNIDPATYYMRPKGVKLTDLLDCYERDVAYELEQIEVRR